MMLKAFLVFFAVAAVDLAWAEYVAAIGAKRAQAAATWAVGIMLASGYVTLMYVHDPLMLIPAAWGAYAGTLLSVRGDLAGRWAWFKRCWRGEW